MWSIVRRVDLLPDQVRCKRPSGSDDMINVGLIARVSLGFCCLLWFAILCSSCGNEHKVDEEKVVLPEMVRNALPLPEPDWTLSDIMGKFEPASDSSFVLVDRTYADREGLYLRRETYEAFKKMHNAAQSDDVNLVIRSATRNFESQKRIWEGKWSGETQLESSLKASDIKSKVERAQAILRYSSMPGTSRHHWGTDIDLNAFNNAYFEHGDGMKEYRWLVTNADKYGFCQPYTAKGQLRPNGYEEEKWHWSYLPLATGLLQSAKSLLQDELISGFEGAEVAASLGIVQHYVLGINPQCLNPSNK